MIAPNRAPGARREDMILTPSLFESTLGAGRWGVAQAARVRPDWVGAHGVPSVAIGAVTARHP